MVEKDVKLLDWTVDWIVDREHCGVIHKLGEDVKLWDCVNR